MGTTAVAGGDPGKGVAVVPVVELDDDELDARLFALRRERDRLVLDEAEVLAEWARRELWRVGGGVNAAHALAGRSGASPARARAEVRRARKVESMPLARVSVLEGRLSLDRFDLLAVANSARRRRVYERDEALLVDHASALCYSDAYRAVRYWCEAADDEVQDDPPGVEPPEPGEPAEPAPDPWAGAEVGERAHVARTLDGVTAVDAVLGAIGGEIVETELRRLEEEIRRADAREGRERTRAQRTAAAMVEMATRSASIPSGARRPRPLFTVVVGADKLRGLCELGSGAIVSPDQLAGHVGTAALESIVFGGEHTILSVSKRRTFRGALRRAIQVRDRHCIHRYGCDVRADDADVDHIRPWREGGTTSQFDARVRCRGHNRIAELDDGDHLPLPEQPVDWLTWARVKARWIYEQDDRTARTRPDRAPPDAT